MKKSISNYRKSTIWGKSKYKIYLLLIALNIFVSNCDKTEFNEKSIVQQTEHQSSKEKVSYRERVDIVDGVLSFTGEKQLDNISFKLFNMDEKSLDQWEIKNNFYSLRRKLNNIYDDILTAKNEKEVLNKIKANKQYIKLVGDRIMPIIENYGDQCITNINGIFFLQNVV